MRARRALQVGRRLAPAPIRLRLLPPRRRGLLLCCGCGVPCLLPLLCCLLRQVRQLAKPEHSVRPLLHAAVERFAVRPAKVDLR